MWNWDFTQYQAPVTSIFWLSDFVLDTSAGEHMRMSADNDHIDAGKVDKDGWHKLSSLDDDNWWQLSGYVHQRTRANRPGCHPCPNVTSFTPFSANVAIFINLQLFFSRNSIDKINFTLYLSFCQSCDESTNLFFIFTKYLCEHLTNSTVPQISFGY